MENETQPSLAPEPATSKVDLHFTPIFKESIGLYKKYFAVISGLMLITAIFSLIIEYFFPSDPTMGSSTFYSVSTSSLTAQTAGIGLVIGIAAMLISYLNYGAALRHISTEGKVGFADSLQQVVGTIREAIVLAIRLFIYTYAWIIIALLALMTIVTIIGGSALFLAPVFGIAMIVFFFILIKRMLAVTFAFPLFLTEEKMEAKQALDQSIALTNGHLSTIFVNYLLLGLAAMVVSFAYGMIIVPFVPTTNITQESYNLVIAALFLPMQVIFASIGVTFTYAFMRKTQGK